MNWLWTDLSIKIVAANPANNLDNAAALLDHCTIRVLCSNMIIPVQTAYHLHTVCQEVRNIHIPCYSLPPVVEHSTVWSFILVLVQNVNAHLHHKAHEKWVSGLDSLVPLVLFSFFFFEALKHLTSRADLAVIIRNEAKSQLLAGEHSISKSPESPQNKIMCPRYKQPTAAFCGVVWLRATSHCCSPAFRCVSALPLFSLALCVLHTFSSLLPFFSPPFQHILFSSWTG